MKLGTTLTKEATSGNYDYYAKKCDLNVSSWIYVPVRNQVKFSGNIKNFKNYNPLLWCLNRKLV